jgi:hypothetical protein
MMSYEPELGDKARYCRCIIIRDGEGMCDVG